jgi:hypothetical protein
MPGSPASSTTPPRPATAASRSAASSASSAWRPTNGVVTPAASQAQPCSKDAKARSHRPWKVGERRHRTGGTLHHQADPIAVIAAA